jgi:S1-C subfamily serine protease
VKKFLFIYNASNDADSDDAWMTWFTSIGQSVVDMGNPFNGGKIVTSAGAKDITEWSDFVGGYSLVNALDMDAAIALAKGCPNKAGVRVFEAIPM